MCKSKYTALILLHASHSPAAMLEALLLNDFAGDTLLQALLHNPFKATPRLSTHMCTTSITSCTSLTLN
jgi:hypothetical protein